MTTLVIVLRAVPLLAFAGPLLLRVGGRRADAKTRARQRGSDRAPVAANLAASGSFYPSLLIFAGSTEGSRALLLASSGSLLAVAGAVLVVRSRAELGPAWSFVPKADRGTGFITTGPYRLVRHPIYLGLALLAIGEAVAFSGWPAVLIALCGIVPTFLWRACAEERLLSGPLARAMPSTGNRPRWSSRAFSEPRPTPRSQRIEATARRTRRAEVFSTYVIRRRDTALLLACMCLLGAVVAARTARLAADPRRLDAHGERRWFVWANREPYAVPALTQASAELRPGEPIVLIVPPSEERLDWWQMIAAYHLPRHPVLGVFVRRLPPQVPQATRVRVRRDGSSHVAPSIADGGR
jgi:protein-S-isoprenylcysteine O-methyltransferase Ste14